MAIAVSMSWLLLKTSNIFFSGSCGKIYLSVLNPELLYAVVVSEPEDELPRREVGISLVVKGSERLVAIEERGLTETEFASDALTAVVILIEPLSVYLVIFVCVGSPGSSESFSLSFLSSPSSEIGLAKPLKL